MNLGFANYGNIVRNMVPLLFIETVRNVLIIS